MNQGAVDIAAGSRHVRRIGVVSIMLACACRPAAPPPAQAGDPTDGTPSAEPSGDSLGRRVPPPSVVAQTESSAASVAGSSRRAAQPPVDGPSVPQRRGTTSLDTTPIKIPPRHETSTIAEISLSTIAGMQPGTVAEVTGRCLGAEPGRLPGPPPNRSAWVLEDSTGVIYVVGPSPTGCSYAQGSPDLLSIQARINEDTLLGFPGQEPIARRYLTRMK